MAQYALQFTAANEETAGTIAFNLGLNWTIEFWMKIPTWSVDYMSIFKSPADNGIVFIQYRDGGGTFHLTGLFAGNEIQFEAFMGTSPSTDWFWVALSADGTSARIYIDGVYKGKGAINSKNVTTNGFVIATSAGWPSGNYGNFTIDELRVSNIGRYTSETTIDVPTMKYSVDANTLALWHFDDGSGTTALDETTNNNDLTLVNTPSWVTGYPFVENAPPNTPTNSTPANAATGQSVSPTLTGSAFSDPDEGDTHTKSQWLIAVQKNDFTNNLVWDSGEETVNLTSIVVNSTNGTFSGGLSGKTALEKGIVYYWKVRHQDNNGSWSSYSTATYFIVTAPDGTVGTKYNPFTKKNDYIRGQKYITSADLLQLAASTDANAPNNSLYFSITQSAMAYKNGDGVVSTVDLTAV
jgi:hypothetical protein